MSWLLWIIHRLHWEQGKLLPIRAVGSVDYPEQPGPSLRGTLNQESLQSTCQIHPKHTVYRCVDGERNISVSGRVVVLQKKPDPSFLPKSPDVTQDKHR